MYVLINCGKGVFLYSMVQLFVTFTTKGKKAKYNDILSGFLNFIMCHMCDGTRSLCTVSHFVHLAKIIPDNDTVHYLVFEFWIYN